MLDAHICAPPLATTTIWPYNTPRLTRYVQGLLKRWVSEAREPRKAPTGRERLPQTCRNASGGVDLAIPDPHHRYPVQLKEA